MDRGRDALDKLVKCGSVMKGHWADTYLNEEKD